MVKHTADIVVLGAGLQGAGVALELARRGHDVTLIEQDAIAMNRASLRNEGKIHLGFIYANDPSRATAFLQLAGALEFRRGVSRWVSEEAWLVRSTPFSYLVAADSAVSADALSEHYEAVADRCRSSMAEDETLDYLGARPDTLVRRLSLDEIARHFEADRFSAGFATAEEAIDTERLAVAVRDALERSERVTLRTGHAVRGIQVRGETYALEGDGPGGAWRVEARQVVNATWERRCALDQQIGIPAPPDLLHRLKYRVIAQLPEAMRGRPSVSMVLGRYGDVVVRPNGTAYLSWYPAGLRGWTHDVEPPRAWDAACRGEAPAAESEAIATEIISAIDAWYPGMADAKPLLIDAGAIVAIGKSDVDDTASALHDRTRIGVLSRGGYHTVETGKLTTAPRFALAAADRVVAFARGGRTVPRSPRAAPRAVALVPTWRAAEFIDTTLEALRAQTYSNLSVLISDDASPDATATICERRAANDPRFRVIRQPKNLGWVGNVNALLEEAAGDYFFFAFQDDLPAPDYVERCVRVLQDHPSAIMAYSDVELVQQDGTREIKSYPELDGIRDALPRGRAVARQFGSWWIPNRGVFRARAGKTIGGLRRHAAGEFSADWPWLLHMSLLGEFLRIPETLVTKIYMPRSLSRSWNFGARSWLAVTASAIGAVQRSPLRIGEKLVLSFDLARFAAAHVGRSTRRRLRPLARRIGLRRRPARAR